MDVLKAALVLFVARLLQLSVLTEYRVVPHLEHRARRAALDRAAPRLGLRRDRRLRDRAAARHGDARTLGVTSLLLTVGGFWIGRYGETTARDRFHAPFVSVAVVTVLYAFGQVLLEFMLGEPAPARARRRRPAGRAAPQPASDAAGLRARSAGSSRRSSSATASARCGSLAERRARGRFLPGDPRVSEPYRLTPQLALRVAMLALPRARRSSLCSSCGSGRCRCSRATGTSHRRTTTACGRSGSRRLAARSSTRPATCSCANVAGTRLELWPSRPAEDLAGRADGAAHALAWSPASRRRRWSPS